MSTRRSSSGNNNNYVGDRHLVKGDRHKKKGIDHHSHRDSGHRCICGYAKCNEVRDGFKGTDSVYDRLAYFLLATKDDRYKVLKWLGSDLAPSNINMPTESELPDIWLRLAKIPAGYEILGDKGFYKADRLNTNVNHVRTPWKLSDKKVQQYRRSGGMIYEDRETSDTRVVVEDDYERYRNEKMLKGTVPYWVVAMLPYVHEWGHANMNILEPMRRPGKKSAIADRRDYWDKHK